MSFVKAVKENEEAHLTERGGPFVDRFVDVGGGEMR